MPISYYPISQSDLATAHNHSMTAAIVTHKGAAADSGHYIGFVKKSVFHGSKAPSLDSAAPSTLSLDEDDEDWYKFDDDKVSVFPKEKLGTLDGGGFLNLLI